MRELRDSVMPRAMLRLCVQGRADKMTGTPVKPLFAACERVVGPAEAGQAVENRVDCKH